MPALFCYLERGSQDPPLFPGLGFTKAEFSRWPDYGKNLKKIMENKLLNLNNEN